tara:strand:+ start:474 stop:686 length:213 start_codon:yes stop_codon:yes gene_type:complete
MKKSQEHLQDIINNYNKGLTINYINLDHFVTTFPNENFDKLIKSYNDQSKLNFFDVQKIDIMLTEINLNK